MAGFQDLINKGMGLLAPSPPASPSELPHNSYQLCKHFYHVLLTQGIHEVKTLIDECPRPLFYHAHTERGFTLFHLASIRGYREAMQIIYRCSEGNSPKSPSEIINTKDSLGFTALHHIMIRGGSLKDRNNTSSHPIDNSVQALGSQFEDDDILDSYEITKWLLGKTGVDVNAKSKEGYTPLDIINALLPDDNDLPETNEAVLMLSMKDLLIEHGAKPTETPFNLNTFQSLVTIFPKIDGMRWREFPAPNVAKPALPEQAESESSQSSVLSTGAPGFFRSNSLSSLNQILHDSPQEIPYESDDDLSTATTSSYDKISRYTASREQSTTRGFNQQR